VLIWRPSSSLISTSIMKTWDRTSSWSCQKRK
jgi:hypothetical protein